MQNLARLAGIQDATSQYPESDNNEPHPTPATDIEAQSSHHQTPSKRPSRANLPSGHRRSIQSTKSLNSLTSSPIRTAAADAPTIPVHTDAIYSDARLRTTEEPSPDDVEPEEEPWGPSHPCFPHPNPYVAQDSVEARTTRVVRIPRTWLEAGDLYPVLDSVYPEILEPHLSDPEFKSLIRRLNALLQEAFSPMTTNAAVDALLGVVTGFLWDDSGYANVKQGGRQIEAYMNEWNRQKQREQKEIKLVPLRLSAYMMLDIQIPDPKLEDIDDEAEAFDGDSTGSGFHATALPAMPAPSYAYTTVR